MGHTEVLGSGEDAFSIKRLEPAEHGRMAEGMLGLIEAQFELFLDDVENVNAQENLVRLATMNTMTARAQVHATLATATSFYEAPPTPEDTDQQFDGEEVDPDETDPELHDGDRPGQWL